jgi:hypothetical protein
MVWVTDLAAPIRLSLLLRRRVALGEGELPDRYVIRGILAGYSKGASLSTACTIAFAHSLAAFVKWHRRFNRAFLKLHKAMIPQERQIRVPAVEPVGKLPRHRRTT